MNAGILRQKYLDFFKTKNHLAQPSGSLIPYDVTGKLDESLLFNGAGMVQFKPYFRGSIEPPCKRLITAQKCIRTVDIDEVGDSSHLTFFEMLGNFSFGDYFKKQAIDNAWEFLTDPKWLGLDPNYFCCTVFEEDSEAKNYWATYWVNAGFDPKNKIFELGEKSNYWPAGAFTSGPPGPCGPNSEIFYWTGAERPPKENYTKEDYLRDEQEGKWLEIWNLVFIQYEWQGQLKNPTQPQLGYQKTGMPSLPFSGIDTGMGLERTAAVLGGYKSVYDTDAIRPIISTLEKLTTGKIYGTHAKHDQAFRIIADHTRAACFCIADRILPSNTGRGYVLRRLIRRAILKGRQTLELNQPFLHHAYQGVFEALGHFYIELSQRQDVILETLKNEEKLFLKTLQAGSSMLQDYLQNISRPGTLPGDVAFKLYDTYGFPLEVTIELCQELNIQVDTQGYNTALEEAQIRSRSTDGMDIIYANDTSHVHEINSANASATTEFVGYQHTSSESIISRIRLRLDPNGHCLSHFEVTLNKTPFYAESGGQSGDQGTLASENFKLRVLDTKKSNGQFWHICEWEHPSHDFTSSTIDDAEALIRKIVLDQSVKAEIDLQRRRQIEKNHTATHLLHAALRDILGKHVTQAGSLVSPEHLRFDFTHGKALTQSELEQVELIINQQIWANTPVTISEDVPIDEARKRGAMALFGEKYGEFVRVVQVGDFSIELCGGTHVPQTGHIGPAKILHESSAASGIRRIELSTGTAAFEWYNHQIHLLKEAATLLRTQPKELAQSIERIQQQNRELNKRIEKLQLQNQSAAESITENLGPIEVNIRILDSSNPREATLIADQYVEKSHNGLILLAVTAEEKVTFICKVGKQALNHGAHAGNIVKELATRAGGGGGGRAEFATAGAKSTPQLQEVFETIKEVVKRQIVSI
jgi:alanyl-tRNA synthetase